MIARVLACGGLRDPILVEANFTVTEVRISPDMKNATAFVVPLGGGEMVAAVSALNRAASFLRGQVGHEMTLRHVPRLVFEADRSYDEASHVNDILARPSVRRDLVTEAAEDPDQPKAGVVESDNGA